LKSESQVPREHCQNESRSHGGAGESSSSSKGTGAGESQVSREHCKSESRVVKADRSQGSIVKVKAGL